MKHRIVRVAAAALLALASLAIPAAEAADLVIQGRVRDASGSGLGGVRVIAFIEGFDKASAISSADGSYVLSFPYDELADVTIAVWWQPVLSDQAPEIVLLRESARSRDLKLWSPCIPRLIAQPSISYDVVLLQENEKFKALGEAECLESGSM